MSIFPRITDIIPGTEKYFFLKKRARHHKIEMIVSRSTIRNGIDQLGQQLTPDKIKLLDKSM